MTWPSMSPQRPDAAWDTDVPDVLRMLEQPGCLLCRTCAEAARTWVRWFGMENHNDPALLRTLGEPAGCTPRIPAGLSQGRLPAPCAHSQIFALGGAIGRAERTAARHGERGQPGSNIVNGARPDTGRDAQEVRPSKPTEPL